MPSAVEAPSTRLVVDEVILDYLLWYCTCSLLTEHRLRATGNVNKSEYAEALRNGDLSMKFVNSFNHSFKRSHPHSPLPEQIVMRLRICRCAVTLLRRIDVTAPDLAPDSNACRQRAEGWLRRKGTPSVLAETDTTAFSQPATPFSPPVLQRNAEILLESLGHTPGSLYGSATLTDALWELLIMTSHLSLRSGEVSEAWMSNTVDMMVQATLEAYRCRGSSGIDAVNESFAFGLTPMDNVADETDDEIMVNEMFAGEDGAVGTDFETMRAEALLELLPPPGVTLESHFEHLAKEYPWAPFESRIVKILQAALNSQPRPTLAQLEQGRLEGFDTQEVRAVLANAGVSDSVWQQ